VQACYSAVCPAAALCSTLSGQTTVDWSQYQLRRHPKLVSLAPARTNCGPYRHRNHPSPCLSSSSSSSSSSRHKTYHHHHQHHLRLSPPRLRPRYRQQ
jgi:hypothetical protein